VSPRLLDDSSPLGPALWAIPRNPCLFILLLSLYPLSWRSWRPYASLERDFALVPSFLRFRSDAVGAVVVVVVVVVGGGGGDGVVLVIVSIVANSSP